MAADSNMGFHRRTAPSSLYNHHMVSFQSRAVGSSAMMIPEDMDGFVGANSTAGMILAGNPCGINDPAVLIPRGNNARGLHHDPVTELKHDTELAVEWSLEEQWLLDTGLVMYANEPNIMKYIKIAAMLQNKTVRDVALRCRWITDPLKNKEQKNISRRQEALFLWPAEGEEVQNLHHPAYTSYKRVHLSTLFFGTPILVIP